MRAEGPFDFDVFEWIRRYYPNLNAHQLTPILHFSLIWNMFETKVGRRLASPAIIRGNVTEAVRKGILQAHEYQPYLDYFRSRYSGRQSHYLDDLFAVMYVGNSRVRETNERYREEMLRVFRGETDDVTEVVYVLLLIAYRVRNNFFHGNKELESLPGQTELFHVVNRLLSKYLDDVYPP